MSSQSIQCAAYTKSGTRCRRNAEPGSLYCWQHQNYQSSNTNTSSQQNYQQSLNTDISLQNQNNKQPSLIQNYEQPSQSQNYKQSSLIQNYEESSDIGTLLNQNLPPELAAITMMYSNTNTEEKKIQNLVGRERKNILKEWFLRINMPIKFENVPESQLKYVWEIYLQRLNDLPVSKVIEEIDQKSGNRLYLSSKFRNIREQEHNLKVLDPKVFDPWIFFSKTIVFLGKLTESEKKEFNDLEVLLNINLNKYENYARQNIDFNKLKKEDLIFFPTREYGIKSIQGRRLIYDGTHLQNLFYGSYGYENGRMPKNFDVALFPLVNYFFWSIGNGDIWYKVPKTGEIKLPKKIISKITSKIDKYITTDGYTIYMKKGRDVRSYFEELNYLSFSCSEQEFSEVFKNISKYEYDYYNMEDIWKNIVMEIQQEQKITTKILFQSKVGYWYWDKRYNN